MSPEDKAHKIVSKWDRKNFGVNYIPALALIDLISQVTQALTLPEVTSEDVEAFKKEQFPEVPRSYEAAQWCCGIDLCFEWMQKKLKGEK